MTHSEPIGDRRAVVIPKKFLDADLSPHCCQPNKQIFAQRVNTG